MKTLNLQRLLVAATLLFFCAGEAAAKRESWKDTQGGQFKGEAVEVLGPFALFRTSLTTGRRLPFRFLRPEDCVRFHHGLADVPAAVTDWANTKSPVPQDFLGRVMRLQDDKLVPVDLKGRPEPKVYVIAFVNNAEGKSWEMLGTVNAKYHELVAAYPGQIEALMFGIGHGRPEHTNMAATMKVPYLVTDLYEQKNFLRVVRFAPADFGLIALSRSGVPLGGVGAPQKAEDIEKFFTELSALLALIQDQNPAGWQDRVHYWAAVQPAIHAQGEAPAILVGNPLAADALRQRGVSRVAAEISLSEKGEVRNVALKPDGIPEALQQPIADVLTRVSVFVPAVKNGRFVESTYSYLLETGL
ncbi:MAG: hypothetical protein NVV63_17600 [Opitutus sp.]|nr:hypothetical protein [Opitutus sp.]